MESESGVTKFTTSRQENFTGFLLKFVKFLVGKYLLVLEPLSISENPNNSVFYYAVGSSLPIL